MLEIRLFQARDKGPEPILGPRAGASLLVGNLANIYCYSQELSGVVNR